MGNALDNTKGNQKGNKLDNTKGNALEYNTLQMGIHK